MNKRERTWKKVKYCGDCEINLCANCWLSWHRQDTSIQAIAQVRLVVKFKTDFIIVLQNQKMNEDTDSEANLSDDPMFAKNDLF